MMALRIRGGMPVGRDGRVHGRFRHTPSTLRSSMVNPNLQNLPRGTGGEDDLQILVKGMFVAPPGFLFGARDYMGIEAKLVGWHADSREYTRLAAIDVHSYFTAHQLYRLGRIGAADLPDLGWSDSDLGAYLKGIKKRWPAERQVAKVCIHSGNYRVGAAHLSETFPTWFPRPKDAAAALGLYYEVFPEINRWHWRICKQAFSGVVAKNSFGHIGRFYHVMTRTGPGPDDYDFGDDAKRRIAFGPQSDAAFIGKRVLKRCYYDYPDTLGRWLRLFIHDEIFYEAPAARAAEADAILQYEMEKPVPELVLPASWNMGPHLSIGTEQKGPASCWAEMH